MIKRKSADRADWQRVTQRRFAMLPLLDADFNGHITLLCIDAVQAPLWVDSNDMRVCVANAGYSWLHQIPQNAPYVVTTMFDARGEIIQWYIDICAQTGVNAQGIPWFDDLYLDVVVTPNGQVSVIDVEELEEALAAGMISATQYALAWATANDIVAAIEQKVCALLNLSAQHRQRLMALLS